MLKMVVLAVVLANQTVYHLCLSLLGISYSMEILKKQSPMLHLKGNGW
jgi:hypothetical protein